MKTRNVTLSLDESLLQRFRVYAATRNQSMSSLMTEAIDRMVENGETRQEKMARMADLLDNGPKSGWDGKITWKREDLYRY